MRNYSFFVLVMISLNQPHTSYADTNYVPVDPEVSKQLSAQGRGELDAAKAAALAEEAIYRNAPVNTNSSNSQFSPTNAALVSIPANQHLYGEPITSAPLAPAAPAAQTAAPVPNTAQLAQTIEEKVKKEIDEKISNFGENLTNKSDPQNAVSNNIQPNMDPAEREKGLMERKLWSNSFYKAAQATDQIECGQVQNTTLITAADLALREKANRDRIACLERKKSIAKQQAMMGNVTVGTTVAAGASVAAYAYGELGMPKAEGEDRESDKDALDKLAKLQNFAGTAMLGAGAVETGMGLATRTLVQGRYKDIADADGVQAAKDANTHAGNNAMMWGAGKIAVGYLMHEQAKQTKENLENLQSVTLNTGSSIESPTSNQPGFYGAATAPAVDRVAVNESGSSHSGSSLPGDTMSARDAIVANNNTSSLDYPLAANQSAGRFKLNDQSVTRGNQNNNVSSQLNAANVSNTGASKRNYVLGLSAEPESTSGRSPASTNYTGTSNSGNNTSATVKPVVVTDNIAKVNLAADGSSMRGVNSENSASLFDITSKRLRSAMKEVKM